MSDDELIKEATETSAWEVIPLIDRPLFVRGYITGAKAKLFEFEQTKLQNAICEESLKKENEQKVKDDAEKYSYSKAVSNHIKYISRDSDVVRKIHNLVKLAYIHGAENKGSK